VRSFQKYFGDGSTTLQKFLLYGSHTTDTSRNSNYEGWNFNSGKYLFTTDTK